MANTDTVHVGPDQEVTSTVDRRECDVMSVQFDQPSATKHIRGAKSNLMKLLSGLENGKTKILAPCQISEK